MSELAELAPQAEVEEVEQEEPDFGNETHVNMVDGEIAIMKEIIAERKLHRDALTNIHQVYKREDARRILEGLPYAGVSLIPVVRERLPHTSVYFYTDTINSIVADLKIKLAQYDSQGDRKMVKCCHDLMKKVEMQRAA